MNPAVAAGRLLMVGAGNMGGAMLARWLATGMPADAVTVVSPSGRAMPGGVRVVSEIPASAVFDTILLGLKPHQLDSIRAPLRGHAPRLVVSILAGVELQTLAGLMQAPVVRAMPNLPVAIGKGVVALHGARGTEAGERAAALMAPLGLVEWIGDERLFDAVTALAGSGPAFLYRFIDALAQAGEALGLPPEQAGRLALATVEGSAFLAGAADVAPGALAERVASPGGSTRKGLDVLDDDAALMKLLSATLAAATRRNAEMAQSARRT